MKRRNLPHGKEVEHMEVDLADLTACRKETNAQACRVYRFARGRPVPDVRHEKQRFLDTINLIAYRAEPAMTNIVGNP